MRSSVNTLPIIAMRPIQRCLATQYIRIPKQQFATTSLARLKGIKWNLKLERSASNYTSGAPFQVFNSEIKRHQRNRAALDPEICRKTDYLRDEIAMRLVERFMVLHKLACVN
jgi:hypothetical protein